MKHLNVELPDRWIKFAQSPFRVVITALTCIALSFGPGLMFTLGRDGASRKDPRVIVCFAAIVLIPMIYLRLAALFITQINADRAELQR